MTDGDLVFDGGFADWKRAAREALARGVPPDRARWLDGSIAQTELAFSLDEPGPAPKQSVSDNRLQIRVPREFATLAAEVALHRDPARWPLLYRLLWRLVREEPHLLEIASDPDVHALRAMAKAVHRDIHKMRAFVRFREVATASGPWFVAWFEPAHLIVEALNLELTPEEIDPTAPLFGDGLGLDSIDILEVALVVSKKYGFQLRSDDDDNVRIFQSLRSLSQHIAQHRVK